MLRFVGRIRPPWFKDGISWGRLPQPHTERDPHRGALHSQFPTKHRPTFDATAAPARCDLSSYTCHRLLSRYVFLFSLLLVQFSLRSGNRQCRKPTPPHSCLHCSVGCYPIIGHLRASPTFILDILRCSASQPGRSQRRLHRRARLRGFSLPNIALDNLRPLPRRIHRALPPGTPQGCIESRRRSARPCARKCIHECA